MFFHVALGVALTIGAYVVYLAATHGLSWTWNWLKDKWLAGKADLAALEARLAALEATLAALKGGQPPPPA